MLSRISNLGGRKFGVENAVSNLEFGGGGKFGVENAISKFLIWGGGGGKFGVENAISNLEFGGWKIWGGKCYLESAIFGVENYLGVENAGKSRISNLGGGENGKFGVENAISNLEFGGWKIWGGKCYLESRIWGWKIWGGKCYLESRIWGVENLGRKMLSRISNLGGGKFGAENAISNLQFGG